MGDAGISATGGSKLGGKAKARRLQLGLSLERMSEVGGPSEKTVGRIERGGQAQRASLSKLDTALQWPAGTAAALQIGHTKPTKAVRAKTAAPQPGHAPGLLAHAVDLLAGYGQMKQTEQIRTAIAAVVATLPALRPDPATPSS